MSKVGRSFTEGWNWTKIAHDKLLVAMQAAGYRSKVKFADKTIVT